ncbi:MAG: short-chain dehydrogenase/reductase [Nocardioidaceae bacterium]|nr:short-chain dehydrogenase/reductase [Nocardioidaceae bacterium]
MTTPPTAVVTGATSGIGRALAGELHRRGWELVLVSRDAERLTAVAEELPGRRRPTEVLLADLSSEDGLAVVERRLRENPPVGLLVNAAGCGTTFPWPDGDLADEETMLALNVVATMRLSHAMVARAREAGSGGVLNVGSTAGIWSTGTYAASKAWVLAASRGLADAVRSEGVRVTVVVPGVTRSEFHARSGTDASGVRSWLWLTPERVAREALDAWEAGRSVVVPGRQYRVLVPLARALPDGTRARLLRALGPLRPAVNR